jgi:predicted nucleic acid-binding protein
MTGLTVHGTGYPLPGGYDALFGALPIKFSNLHLNQLCILTYQEVIQGALNENDFASLSDYLVEQTFFYPKHHLETYSQAARIYFACRRKGLTIRSTIDCLIAQTAIEHDLVLLHNDKDFEHIANVFPELKLFQVLQG